MNILYIQLQLYNIKAPINCTTLYAKLPLFDHPWIHRCAPLEVRSCRDPKRQRCRPQARPASVNAASKTKIHHSNTERCVQAFWEPE